MNRKRALRIAPSHYHVGHIVPATVAKEMLFFEDEGLEDYEIVGGGIIPALAEGIGLRRAMKEKSIDIVPDAKPLSVFSLRDKGEDIYIIGCWRNRQPTAFVGGKGIKTLADLKGKKIGTRDLGGIGYTLLATQLRKAGLDPDKDVTWVTGSRFHAQDNPMETLRKGEVDCVHLGSDDDPRDVEREGFSILFDSRVYGSLSRPSRITAGTRSVIEERKEELEAYFRAIIRAYWFIVDHERNGRYLDALVRRLRRICLDVEESQRPSLESGGGSVLPFDGAPSVEGLSHILKEAKETGQISASLDLKDVLALDAVQRAFQQLRQREALSGEISRAKEVFAIRDAESAA
jgi:ABC-type nitrate/sulfonate/bicarbonate transport system substrate-binding protein